MNILSASARSTHVRSLEQIYGFEVLFIRGLEKIWARVGLALASVAAGREERMRSLARPFPLADTG